MTASSPVPLVIGGKDIITTALFDVVGPSDGKVVHQSSDATAEHAVAAVEAAQAAFPEWSQKTPTARRDVFLKAAEVMKQREAELGAYIEQETGGTKDWAAFNTHLGRECLLGCAGIISSIKGSISTLEDPDYGALIVKEPYGVVFAMAPWYVFLMSFKDNVRLILIISGTVRTRLASAPLVGP